MRRAAAWRQDPTPRRRAEVSRFRLRARLAGLMVLLCWIVPGSAVAQESPPVAEDRTASRRQTPLVTDTITVTATKTRRDPVETPGEVNIIRRHEIDLMQARSLDDVLRYQPGIEVGGGPRRLVEVPSIRGLSGSRVLATVDGVRLNYSSGHQGRLFLDVDALGQIEVVRGPNSALWGSGAVGGVLAMSTLDPADFLEDEDRMGAQLKLGFQGVSDEWLTGGMLAGRLGANVEYLGSFTLRGAQGIELGGGAGPLENSAETLRGGLGKVIWRPAGHTQLRFSIQGFEEDGEVPTAPNVTRTGPPSGLVDRQTTQMTYRLGYAFENDENPYFRVYGFAYHTTMDIRRRRLSDDRPDATHYDTTGFDLRNSSVLQLSPSQRHVLTYGLEYFHDRQRAEQQGNPYLLFPDANADTVSLYVQDEVVLGEKVFLIPAVRWDRSRNSTVGHDDVTNSQLSPKLGGVFRATDFLYLEANYAEGFRSPAFQDLYISGTHFPGAIFLPNPELKPEKSRNVDVGLRLRSAGLLGDDDSVLFRLAYFRNRVDDFIDFNSTFNPTTQHAELQFVNVQKALIQGIEAELRWVFMTGLDVWASYTDIRGDDITGGGKEGDIPLEGIQPPKGVIGVSYTHWPWDVTLGGRVQVVSGQKRVPEDVQETPGFSVYDIFATWQPHRGPLWGVRIDLGVDNLTDKAYRRHLASIPEAGINPKATISYTRAW